jgi:hypothetical protein
MTKRRSAPATDGFPLLIGAILLFQGAGRLAGAERRWFVVHYLDFLQGNETVGYVAFAIAGLAVLVAGGDQHRRNGSELRQDRMSTRP